MYSIQRRASTGMTSGKATRMRNREIVGERKSSVCRLWLIRYVCGLCIPSVQHYIYIQLYHIKQLPFHQFTDRNNIATYVYFVMKGVGKNKRNDEGNDPSFSADYRKQLACTTFFAFTRVPQHPYPSLYPLPRWG